MAKKIPIGIDDFSELVSSHSNFLFVDKSLMIKELIEKGTKVSLIIRPRRWGKTLNMSMLQHFFAPKVNGRLTQGIFDNLKIAKEEKGAYLKYQGNFPVIFISFKDAKKDNFDDFLEKTKGLIQEICNQHPELLTSQNLSEEEQNSFKKLIGKTANTVEVCDALKTISVLLNKHYDNKVFILIDEYDTPLNAAYGKPYFDDVVNFFKGMFGAALKGNNSLEKGVMTGVLRLSKNKMLSDINNFKLYSFIEEQYSQCFGFSEKEIKLLFKESDVDLDIKEVHRWYNGYQAGDLENVYNPWSILNCIDDGGKLKPYWIKTGDEDILKISLLDATIEVKEKLNLLLIGEPIESVIDEYFSFDQIKGNDEALWSLLWALGYLKTVGTPKSFGARYKYQLKIPNHEVACSYRDVFQTFMSSLDNTYKYDSFLKNLISGKVDAFIKDLKDYMSTIPSWFDFPRESNYHTFLLGLTAALSETHDIYSNKEIGFGRPDLLLVPRDLKNSLGIILEFKRDEP